VAQYKNASIGGRFGMFLLESARVYWGFIIGVLYRGGTQYGKK
jgi:hypothetical protein